MTFPSTTMTNEQICKRFSDLEDLIKSETRANELYRNEQKEMSDRINDYVRFKSTNDACNKCGFGLIVASGVVGAGAAITYIIIGKEAADYVGVSIGTVLALDLVAVPLIESAKIPISSDVLLGKILFDNPKITLADAKLKLKDLLVNTTVIHNYQVRNI